MAGNGMTRRGMLRSGAGVIAAGSVLQAPMVHAQGTGGRLAIGFWDHWVPAGNDAMRGIVTAWAQANRVEVQMDFITSVGNKLLLTMAAEAQARQGHDIIAMDTWRVFEYQRQLEPVDDVVGRLIQQHGPVNPISEYLGKPGGSWHAVPATMGSQYKGAAGAHRPDEAACRHRPAGDVPGREPARPRRRDLDLGDLPEGRRGLQQGGLPLRPALRHLLRRGGLGRRLLRRARRLHDRQGGNTTLRNNDKSARRWSISSACSSTSRTRCSPPTTRRTTAR